MTSDYTDEQRYIDAEYPENLAAKLRAADIGISDPLPAWAVRDLENNLYGDVPSLAPGEALADRNPIAYTAFHVTWTEARTIKRATLDKRHHGDDLASRCRRASAGAVLDVCNEAMDEAVKTYVEAVSKGATP